MQYSKEEKAKRIEEWRQSGKSAWSYAKENGIVPQTFIRWTRMEKETKQTFIEVPVQVIQSQPQVREILIEKGGIKIHIPQGSDLRAVMEGILGVL